MHTSTGFTTTSTIGFEVHYDSVTPGKRSAKAQQNTPKGTVVANSTPWSYCLGFRRRGDRCSNCFVDFQTECRRNNTEIKRLRCAGCLSEPCFYCSKVSIWCLLCLSRVYAQGLIDGCLSYLAGDESVVVGTPAQLYSGVT